MLEFKPKSRVTLLDRLRTVTALLREHLGGGHEQPQVENGVLPGSGLGVESWDRSVYTRRKLSSPKSQRITTCAMLFPLFSNNIPNRGDLYEYEDFRSTSSRAGCRD